MAVGQDLPERRTQQAVSAEWGTGVSYGRVYVVQNAKDANDLIASGGTLELGADLPTLWYPDGVTAPATTIATAKLQSAAAQIERNQQTCRHLVVCQFLALDCGTITNAYGTLTAIRKVAGTQFDNVYETWGVAAATNSAGIPAIGTVSSGSNQTAVRLFEQRMISSYHGRVLVHSLYRALIAGAVTANLKASDLLAY